MREQNWILNAIIMTSFLFVETYSLSASPKGLRAVLIYTFDDSIIGADIKTQEVNAEIFKNFSSIEEIISKPTSLTSSFELLNFLYDRCDVQLKCNVQPKELNCEKCEILKDCEEKTTTISTNIPKRTRKTEQLTSFTDFAIEKVSKKTTPSTVTSKELNITPNITSKTAESTESSTTAVSSSTEAEKALKVTQSPTKEIPAAEDSEPSIIVTKLVSNKSEVTKSSQLATRRTPRTRSTTENSKITSKSYQKSRRRTTTISKDKVASELKTTTVPVTKITSETVSFALPKIFTEEKSTFNEIETTHKIFTEIISKTTDKTSSSSLTTQKSTAMSSKSKTTEPIKQSETFTEVKTETTTKPSPPVKRTTRKPFKGPTYLPQPKRSRETQQPWTGTYKRYTGTFRQGWTWQPFTGGQTWRTRISPTRETTAKVQYEKIDYDNVFGSLFANDL